MPFLGLGHALPRIRLPPEQAHRALELGQQLRGQAVVKQVDEAAETFPGAGVPARAHQDLHQVVITVGAAWVGLAQHLAHHGRPGQQAEQAADQPALTHQAHQQGPAPALQRWQFRQPFAIEGALGAIDQDHLGGGLALLGQQPGGIEGHHATDGITHQLQP